ncbi:S1 family peptidase [Streptomyces sp. NPDC008122]|uniref:S1 family peptidase n=1 Tax=Streptomyces sp. NPDC008122 TaxID=3364810 RepID=UPI0036E7BB43
MAKEVLVRQHQLDAIADEITQNRPEHERFRVPGYAGIVVDADNGRLNVYWKGPLPERVHNLAAQAPHGLKVDVRPARYSAAEVKTAQRKLLTNSSRRGDGLLPGGRPWTSLATSPTGDGLIIGYEPEKGLSRAQQDGESSEVAAATQKATGVAVTAMPKRRSQISARQDDYSPWWGGAGLRTPANSFCSSGFSVYFPSGAPGMLTAAHCGMDGQFFDRQGELIGEAILKRRDLDVTVIGVENGAVGGYYYDGPWSTDIGKHVIGWNTNYVGDYVCTSGAMSGVHCNNKVNSIEDDIVQDDGTHVGPVVFAQRTDLQDVSHSKGDSGGPVVTSPDGTYGFDMEARGIISVGRGEPTVCIPGETQRPDVMCFSTVGYIPMGTIMNTFGLTLATD